MKKLLFLPVVMLLVVSLITGCSLDSVLQPAASNNIAGSGKLELRITDAPRQADNVSAVYVKVGEIQVHQAGAADEDDDNGDWITAVINDDKYYELLSLRGANIQEVLGSVDLTSGNYTQVRLLVTDVQVEFDGTDNITATVPSGKIKFVHPFQIIDGETTAMIFDFDADKSVIVHKNGKDGEPKVTFKPVIKVISEKPQGDDDDEDNQAEDIEIEPETLIDGYINEPYHVDLTANEGTEPYSWSLFGTGLPTGMSVDNTTSSINGTPTETGTFNFVVRVTDNGTPQKTGTRAYTLTIKTRVDITTTTLSTANTSILYSVTLEATGGSGSYAWTDNGSLPAGLSLSAEGTISGTATTTGIYSFEVTATDTEDVANLDTQVLTIQVEE